jgi:acetylornithine deacetylase/succinyl-diaminopimelate desuccinylase-like protein
MRVLGILLIVLLAYACSLKSIRRNVSSLDVSVPDESEIIDRAYRCLHKLEYLNSFEVDFKKDESAIQEAFTTCLSEYLQIKTVSPVGYEEKAVLFLSTIFENLNFPYKIYKVPSLIPGQDHKFNIVATLPKDGGTTYDYAKDHKVPGVILTHHMDVVPVNKEQWHRVDLPFSGSVEDGPDGEKRKYVWGRGALDMKGIGVAHLITMMLYKKTQPNRKVDIHFLGLGDEEQNGSGAIGTLKLMGKGKELYALSKSKILLNEGGGGLEDQPSKGVNLQAISVEQKGGSWMKLSRKKPMRLLKSLNKLKLLNVSKKKQRKYRIDKRIKCDVVEVDGPEPKVNVVASEVTVKLRCLKEKKDLDDVAKIVKDVIEKDTKGVKFKVTQEDDLISININTSSSSHGSITLNQSAIDYLAQSLYRLRLYKLKNRKTPRLFKHKRTKATKTFIKKLEPHNKQLKFFNKFSWIPFVKRLILKQVEGEFGTEGIFRTNCTLTNFIFKLGRADAYLDCRLLHTAFIYKNMDNHAEKFIKHLLRKKFLERDLKIDLLSGWNYTSSSINSKDYKAIIKVLQAQDPKAIVTPYLNPAGSDSAWFRNPKVLGIVDVESIPSYGVFPGNFTIELLGTIHGSDERFPVDQMSKTVESYYKILQGLDY